MERGHQGSRGVGLLEVLAVLAVLSVLVSWAVPSWTALSHDAGRSAMANGFLADLALARTESVRRGRRVVLCVSSDGQACAASGNWQQGRIVFEDTNNSGWREAGEPLLLAQAGETDGWLFDGNTPVARYISYHPSGQTRTPGGGFQAGTVTICRLTGSPTTVTKIVINRVGRPRAQRSEGAACA